jgi:cytochrome P450
MVYLEQISKEVRRFFALNSATFFGRLTAPMEVGGYRIPAGWAAMGAIHINMRNPDVFPDPDRFDLHRPNLSQQVAFAHGPHVCLGLHLARLETRVALERTLARLPGLRLDPERPAAPRGLVFRKPSSVNVLFDAG